VFIRAKDDVNDCHLARNNVDAVLILPTSGRCENTR
jgi:hypothetical protein